jgi:protein-L-isoaspartate(D-aspartate) O-methyltransferase
MKPSWLTPLFFGLSACNPEGHLRAADWSTLREAMVKDQIEQRGIHDARVLAALRSVPRHELVPEEQRAWSYHDRPLPIGYGQTISQPFIVAFMTEHLAPRPSDRVLEIGTGSGYQAAVLGKLVAEVFTIEIVEPLAKRAAAEVARLGFKNIRVRYGDGHLGWPEAAPFDAIIVTCAPEAVPPPLRDQLKEGGRMVMPVGPAGAQTLLVLEKRAGNLERIADLPVAFVPMTRGDELGEEKEKEND